jgi:hypothetical protein
VNRSMRPAWDFAYAPLPMGGGSAGEGDCDLVLSTVEDVDAARLLELAGREFTDIAITPLFNSHPIFWTRIQSSSVICIPKLVAAVSAGGIRVRYATSAREGSQSLPPPLDFSEARPRAARDWPVRRAEHATDLDTPWRWFLRPEGADVSRSCCGAGAGTRLAVIDNDGSKLNRTALDAEVPVGVPVIPRTQEHAALLVAWAVGAQRDDGTRFRGVAPDAAPRVYCIPKPGADVVSLPLGILRAVEDGADCIVCATYVEGLTSPLLDDALEFAARVGRGGRGTLVVFPTGREMSSAEGSTHSSLSLGLAEPASDPRAVCVGPSARDGGWFLWRDRKGKFRPFANRGPSVRWLAPGDDLAYPFSVDDRPTHAESSGAAAIAAGVILLVLAGNPDLTRDEVETLVTRTAIEVDPSRLVGHPDLADRRDLEPCGVDPDGHNAKHGYGRVSARRACLAAADPIAQALLAIGEEQAAEAFSVTRATALGSLYSRDVARYAARVLLRDASIAQAVKALARALRLAAGSWEPALEPCGYWLRQIRVVLRMLLATDAPLELAAELRALDASLGLADANATRELEARLVQLFRTLWNVAPPPSQIVELRESRERVAPVIDTRTRTWGR